MTGRLLVDEVQLGGHLIQMLDASRSDGRVSTHFQVIEFANDRSLVVGPGGTASREVSTVAIRRLQLVGLIQATAWRHLGFRFVLADDARRRYARLRTWQGRLIVSALPTSTVTILPGGADGCAAGRSDPGARPGQQAHQRRLCFSSGHGPQRIGV